MQLTEDQIKSFKDTGYLFLPELFSTDEVDVLTGALPEIFAMRRPEIVREKESDAVRISFGTHTYSEPFARLSRHPRLVEPARQLLDGGVYLHQFKVNQKAAFDGDVWQWHQDYGTWSVDDGMPESNALNVALFLDDVTAVNGPLMFIPGSHKIGRIDAKYDTKTTSYALWTVDRETIKDLAGTHGIVAPTGRAGSVILFHCTLLHASPGNLSPWSRNIVYLTTNAVGNEIRKPTRPEYIASQDFTPLEPLSDDCLVQSDGKPFSAAAE